MPAGLPADQPKDQSATGRIRCGEQSEALVAQTHCRKKLTVDTAVNAQAVRAFIRADCPARLWSNDAIDCAMIVAGARQSLLNANNDVGAHRLSAVNRTRVIAVAVRIRAVAGRV